MRLELLDPQIHRQQHLNDRVPPRVIDRLRVELRMIQEFLGHADSKTTQIYAHYAPSEHEVQMVNDAFTPSADAVDQAPASQTPADVSE